MTNDINCFRTIEEGIQCSAESQKPIFLIFTNWAIGKSSMEENVLPKKRIKNKLQNEFVVVTLFVDSREKLTPNEIGEYSHSKFLGRPMKTVGDFNVHYEMKHFEQLVQPYIAILSSIDTSVIAEFGYAPDIDEVDSILTKAIDIHQVQLNNL